jgi:hypothetical protein
MNYAELGELDAQRKAAGNLQRGEQLRLSWSGKSPALRIPEFNRQAYVALARSSANLTQISDHLATGHGETQHVIGQAATKLEAFRASLLISQPADGSPETSAERTAEAASREDRRLRRGPFKLPPGELRDYVVAVRLSAAELDELDIQRRQGDAKRGEWLRMAWQELTEHDVIPAISATAYDALDRSADNLNNIARYLNEGGAVAGRISLIDEELAAFIQNLNKADNSKE